MWVLSRKYSKFSLNKILVTDTQAVWFSMLETGLALIAINLPSIWGLTSHISIGSVLRSVRSLLSVHSHDSSGSSKRYNGLKDDSYNHRNSDAGSQSVELVPPVGSGKLNTAITSKVKSEHDKDHHKARYDLEDGISVQWSMQQTEMNLDSKSGSRNI